MNALDVVMGGNLLGACVRALSAGAPPERFANAQRLRQFFGVVCEKRGVPNFFDRFEADSVDSGGLRLHLDVIEVDRSAPTVVFMPGTNAYAMLYGEFLTALADRGFNVVGFDPRGHGRSGGQRGSYTIAELVMDMDAAVQYARGRFHGPVAVAGSSQGGITAFYYAASGAPVVGAVCHNAADLSDPDSVRLTRMPRLASALRPALLAAAQVAPELPVPMTAYLDLHREPVRGMGNARKVLYTDPLLVPFVRLKTMASLGSAELPTAVESIRTPVMLLQAGADTIFPTDYMATLYRRLTCPHKAFKVYEGLPHYMIVDFVDEFIDDVELWLGEVCGAAHREVRP